MERLYANRLFDRSYTGKSSTDAISVDLSRFNAIVVRIGGDGEVSDIISRPVSSWNKVVSSAISKDDVTEYARVVFVAVDWDKDIIRIRCSAIRGWSYADVVLYGLE